MDGVDPLDRSPNGVMVFNCYVKRKQIEWMQAAAMMAASTAPGKDSTDLIKELEKIIIPSDPRQMEREIMQKNAKIQKDKTSVFLKETNSDGSVSLRMELDEEWL